MNKIKLFCFPFAGGSAMAVFNKWKSFLHESIELRPVELAGRGSKVLQPLYRDINQAVTSILDEIRTELKEGPYALLGHSMGTLLAHELANAIRREGLNKPAHLFFIGRGAPSVTVKEEDKYHLLDDVRFKQKILELGGTPPEFFEHPELMDLFMPLLRNDFRLATTDLSHLEIRPHDCPISVLLGKSEDISAERADAWKLHTKGICTLYYFNGGHFFYNDQLPQVVSLLNAQLSVCLQTFDRAGHRNFNGLITHDDHRNKDGQHA